MYDLLTASHLASSLTGTWFKNAMKQLQSYFEGQDKGKIQYVYVQRYIYHKLDVNIGVILASTTHINTYGLTKMLAYNPDFQQLHALGRFQAYERGTPLQPLLSLMHSMPPLYLFLIFYICIYFFAESVVMLYDFDVTKRAKEVNSNQYSINYFIPKLVVFISVGIAVTCGVAWKYFNSSIFPTYLTIIKAKIRVLS